MSITTVETTSRLPLVSKVATALTAFWLFIVLGTTSAFADTVTPDPHAPVTIPQLTPQYVAGLIGLLIPILVSLLARWNASAIVKVVLNLALTAVTGAVASLVVLDPGTGEAHFGWVPFLTSFAFAFVASGVSYLQVLQHLPLNNILLNAGGIVGAKGPDASLPAGPVEGDISPDTGAQDTPYVMTEADKADAAAADTPYTVPDVPVVPPVDPPAGA